MATYLVTKLRPNGREIGVKWRWPEGTPRWTMVEAASSVQSVPVGDLDSEGRRLVLAHFGLFPLRRDLPCHVLVKLSQQELCRRRRRLERASNLEPLSLVGQELGGRRKAEVVT